MDNVFYYITSGSIIFNIRARIRIRTCVYSIISRTRIERILPVLTNNNYVSIGIYTKYKYKYVVVYYRLFNLNCSFLI